MKVHKKNIFVPCIDYIMGGLDDKYHIRANPSSYLGYCKKFITEIGEMKSMPAQARCNDTTSYNRLWELYGSNEPPQCEELIMKLSLIKPVKLNTFVGLAISIPEPTMGI